MGLLRSLSSAPLSSAPLVLLAAVLALGGVRTPPTPSSSLFASSSAFFMLPQICGACAAGSVGTDDLEFQNHYEVLGVDQTATDAEIKKAYRALARKYHPDKVQDPSDKEMATNIFMAIGRAQETLMDKDKRSMFDDELYFGMRRGRRGGGRGDGFSEGGIFEQLRKERLRKQEARKNSWMGRFDGVLTYILPLFLIFGFLRAQGGLDNLFGGGASAGNRSPPPQHQSSSDNTTSDGDSSSGGTARDDCPGDHTNSASVEPNASSSPHDADAITLAPTLGKLVDSHLSVKFFLVVFCVRREPTEDLPWAELDAIAKARRTDMKLRFVWSDVDSLSEDSRCGRILRRCGAHRASTICTVVLRPKKSKGVVYDLASGTMAIKDGRLGRWLDSFGDGAVKMSEGFGPEA